MMLGAMAQPEKTRTRTTSGTTRKPPAKASPRAKAPEPEARNALAEAAHEAQREVLLDALRANGWSLSATAEALRLHGPSAVIRYIGSLDLTDEYEKARTTGKVKQGRPKS
ncbi:MAG: hypothetical protein Q8S73_26585 [Deltaproteobacteria bacterium]|nr:hypothetical protein [Myxococcales bacterium]MDP3217703.1 hypothetical protein [Deltaproteobacteria bacterium]